MMNHYKKIIFLVVILAVLSASLGVSVQNVHASSCTQYHVVKKGEWLAQIARKYGVSWKYLAQINNLQNPSKIYPGQKLCVSTSGGSSPPKPQTTIPTFSITAVSRDENVSIRTNNFPAGETFQVLMGPYGTQANNGIKVTTWASEGGGTRDATFPIPTQLKGSYRIAIRLESISGSGKYAYNWFYNNTTNGGGNGNGTGGAEPVPDYSGIPVFYISAVTRDQNVTITTNNFPPGLTFDVRMGPMGTRGINGIKVGTLNSGQGGKMTATYAIPAALQGSYQISIRTQNWSTGYYAYNWFYNNTTN